MKVNGIKIEGSKPCPVCGKTISMNKELCFACFTTYGSIENWQKHQLEAAQQIEADNAASAKPKRTRKPKTADATATEPKPRKPRAKKTAEAVAA